MTIGTGSQELSSLRARCASLESRLKDEVSAHACTTAPLQEAVGRAEREEKLRRVLENLPVMMNAVDDDGVCVAWNREW